MLILNEVVVDKLVRVKSKSGSKVVRLASKNHQNSQVVTKTAILLLMDRVDEQMRL